MATRTTWARVSSDRSADHFMTSSLRNHETIWDAFVWRWWVLLVHTGLELGLDHQGRSLWYREILTIASSSHERRSVEIFGSCHRFVAEESFPGVSISSLPTTVLSPSSASGSFALTFSKCDQSASTAENSLPTYAQQSRSAYASHRFSWEPNLTDRDDALQAPVQLVGVL